jgi:2-polyprenyl-3-methyl-5-hydroxy-6-metoxy-1,4-benzoquinol methylase
MHDELLQQQIDYYRARAREYDEWFLRQGRYDHGAEVNHRWFAEVAQVVDALDVFEPTGDVLELACGTGLWTQQLVRHAGRVTAVDAAAEVIAINRQRLGPDAPVEYVQADLFSWRPSRQYDVVFFSFWLSHVPPERFDAFWDLVRSALKPGGRVFFVDSLYIESSTARDHRLEGDDATAVTRRLNGGETFRIVKVFYRPAELEARLKARGWEIAVEATPNYFLYGLGSPAH